MRWWAASCRDHVFYDKAAGAGLKSGVSTKYPPPAFTVQHRHPIGYMEIVAGMPAAVGCDSPSKPLELDGDR